MCDDSDFAWTCSDYAERLIDRDAPCDRKKGSERQDEAFATAQELGVKPLLERVLTQRVRLRRMKA